MNKMNSMFGLCLVLWSANTFAMSNEAKINKLSNQINYLISQQNNSKSVELESKVGEIQNISEINQFKLKKLLKKITEIEINNRNLKSNINTMSVDIKKLKDENKLLKLQQSKPLNSNITDKKKTIKENVAPQVLFDNSYNDMQEKKYTNAKQGFNEFVTKYPYVKGAAASRYWLGKMSLNDGNLSDAQKQFTVLVNKYPKNKLAVEARYNLGMIFLANDEVLSAEKSFEFIIDNHHDSKYTVLATNALENIPNELLK